MESLITGALLFVVFLLAITNGYLAFSQQSLRRRIRLFLDRAMDANKLVEEMAKDRERLAIIEDNLNKHMEYLEILGRAMKIYESQTQILAKRKEESKAIQARFQSRPLR
jgi:hypothetical protein